eukprot:scaffold310180_cov30-Tisochrysis_lutea.AAC.3
MLRLSRLGSLATVWLRNEASCAESACQMRRSRSFETRARTAQHVARWIALKEVPALAWRESTSAAVAVREIRAVRRRPLALAGCARRVCAGRAEHVLSRCACTASPQSSNGRMRRQRGAVPIGRKGRRRKENKGKM